jgi:tetratricopeptide (TPR) repeat protein
VDRKAQLEQALAGGARLSSTQIVDLSLDALDCGLFEAVVARIEREAAAGRADAPMFQVLGLAYRELLDGAEAVAAFERAASLAPRDARIAHGLARSTWEAGLPALDRYDAALALSPKDAGMLIGRAAALVSDGRGGEAEAFLRELLLQNPGWYEGHEAYARITAAARLACDGTGSVRSAIQQFPKDRSLWRVLLRLLLDARRYPEVVGTARSAALSLGEADDWRRAEAQALSELDEASSAQTLLDALQPVPGAAGLLTPLRNLIRLGRLDEASALAERRFPASEDAQLWPYRSLLWRLRDDPRWAWLEGNERLVGMTDLGLSAAEIRSLADLLRRLHTRSGELADQSVRGGTQTADMLFRRSASEISRLKIKLQEAVQTFIAELPPIDPEHPVLGFERAAPVRFSGAWSVRLGGGGRHASHVHPEGWFSAAFYVSVPDETQERDGAGWLNLGDGPADLGVALPPIRSIVPKPARLVLFPSIMWHGTEPFTEGERLTISFDVARPYA